MSKSKRTPQQLAGVMYQIYPRSFMDSNDDGIGDIKGIISKLDYLAELGVNSIWISPIYPSPMADFGYDISDYHNVEPAFGTLKDFDNLITEAKARNIKIVMDYVVNHTSDQHDWFKHSCVTRDSNKRDWYIWADPAKEGGPPNNWVSIFGGSAWEFEASSGQYYMHTFLKEQPDLNWRNPEVKKAMMDVLRFWIDRGVDGFRTDAFVHVFKDKQLRDEPLNPDFKKGDWQWIKLIHSRSQRQPELHVMYEYFDELFDEYPDRDLFMVTEDYAGIDDINWHYTHSNNARFAPLNLQFSELKWNINTVQHFINEYLSNLSEANWPNFALGNHDLPRVGTRAGVKSTRIAALLTLTLRGIPIVYYGDEIGMTDVKIPRDRIRDPVSLRDPNKGGRDPQRTPMQWDSTKNSGFTKADPWLPIPKSFKKVNATRQLQDPTSLISLYKRLIKIRSSSEALSVGSYLPHESSNKNIMSYWRKVDDEKLLVAINFSGKTQTLDLGSKKFEMIFSTTMKDSNEQVSKKIKLPAYSGVILSSS